ncbi:unnamed protein product [Colias eurytheme]|nr:unnamed protein product [Colias eurytheme]
MLVRGCAGGELRHSLSERTKALAAKCHALRSPAREQRSAERRRTRHRKSQTRWYVKVSCGSFWCSPTLHYQLLRLMIDKQCSWKTYNKAI